ncbi:MAG: inorganic phosphate transporter [Spirochaetales bacterium]|nr:inorganic phosphate transporter [Spirochaetales bacterium]
MVTLLIFLSSGLFLGWSLGANDAANVFGTAVGTKMIRFRTAAIIASCFVILGAVISGAGASHTLGKLGAVNALPGSFTVAFSAGFTVFWMTRLKLPVSTSQAIVGAIIGWNFFSGNETDLSALTKIVSTWVICPVLSASFSMAIYFLVRFVLRHAKIHILRLDFLTRMALVGAGAFGAYSLGANNIANVMGVFIPVSPFRDVSVFGQWQLNGVQILFLTGGAAIALGIITYSKKVMMTVGNSIFKLSPVTAFIVVLSSSLVLFLFASQGLKFWLESRGLPSFPLVPVSSSQAVVGAVLGIGLAKSGRNIHFAVIGRIGLGWVATPLAAGILAFVLLFIMQNLFMQPVFN